MTVSLSGMTIARGNAGSGFGGGIRNSGSLTVSDCTFTNNSSNVIGGGLFNGFGATATVTNCTFANNFTSSFPSNGGGIYNINATLTVSGSTFVGNYATEGGGINTINGTLTVNGSSFTGNSAKSDFAAGYDNGGGILSQGGTTTLSGSSFTGNSAGFGGGLQPVVGLRR